MKDYAGPAKQAQPTRGLNTRVDIAFALDCLEREAQTGWMFSACGPFWPWVTSKLTFWPSWSSR